MIVAFIVAQTGSKMIKTSSNCQQSERSHDLQCSTSIVNVAFLLFLCFLPIGNVDVHQMSAAFDLKINPLISFEVV